MDLSQQVKLGSENRAQITAPWPLAIGASKISRAGRGIITNEDLPCCLVFGPYQGKIINVPVGREESGYGWLIRSQDHKNLCVDAIDPNDSNWMRFVNCATDQKSVNLAAFQFKGQIYYKIIKYIKRYASIY